MIIGAIIVGILIFALMILGEHISERCGGDFEFGAIIGAVITILLTSAVSVVLPYLLSFAAGAMIYVVVEELIPEANSGKHSNISTIGLSFGFVIMMILDVALG